MKFAMRSGGELRKPDLSIINEYCTDEFAVGVKLGFPASLHYTYSACCSGSYTRRLQDFNVTPKILFVRLSGMREFLSVYLDVGGTGECQS